MKHANKLDNRFRKIWRNYTGENETLREDRWEKCVNYVSKNMGEYFPKFTGNYSFLRS